MCANACDVVGISAHQPDVQINMGLIIGRSLGEMDVLGIVVRGVHAQWGRSWPRTQHNTTRVTRKHMHRKQVI